MLQIIPRISLWTEDLKFSTDANLLSDTMEQDEEILAYRLSIQSQKILFLKWSYYYLKQGSSLEQPWIWG